MNGPSGGTLHRYGVQFLSTASAVIYVEAESSEDARYKADELFNRPSICHQCSREVEIGDDFEQDESEHGVWEA